jgi:phospholipase C
VDFLNGDGMGQLKRVNHIVVLMLENRSFDCLLGKLYDSPRRLRGVER